MVAELSNQDAATDYHGDTDQSIVLSIDTSSARPSRAVELGMRVVVTNAVVRPQRGRSRPATSRRLPLHHGM